METGNIIRKSLIYPLQDYSKLMTIGIIAILTNITAVFTSLTGITNYTGAYGTLIAILGIIGIIFSFILGGYTISVIKSSINGKQFIPDFEWKNNFIMGIKAFIVSFIYYLIPIIIIAIVGWSTGLLDSGIALFTSPDFADMAAQAANGTAISGSSIVAQPIWDTFVTSMAITSIVAIILLIIFTLLLTIAQCRLADTNSLKEGLNVLKAVTDMKEIGTGSYIIWYLIMIIIMCVLVFILAIVSAIPIIGMLLGSLLVTPFITLFTARSAGLMYASK